ncbi:MAG: M2 family metallopeptidase [Myxococcaceae bacterium]
MNLPRLLLVVLLFCAPALAAKPKGPAATPAEAKLFVARVNEELKALWVKSATADWIKATYITDDTERNAAAATESVMAFMSRSIRESVRFKGLKLDPETARFIYLLRNASALPAPNDAAKRGELALIAAKLEGIYGKGKWCGKGYVAGKSEAEDKKRCRDLEQLSEVLEKSRTYDELLDAWAGWHTISREMKPMYARLVELSNEGAREIGPKDLGELWRSGYDMPPAEIEKEADRLWGQVKPLYEQLHCYVRAQLAKKYGKDKVPADGPIPAHLLGNMWAQEWQNIYPLVEPYPGQQSLDVSAALKAQGYDEKKLVRLGESFFTSLGLDPLPATFWERSQFTKPLDREVVCHASAWDVQFNDDLRIKMCIKVDEDNLRTIHHELGHDYYYHYYYKLPALHQQGANDGFHEAIGDALVLSITPGYLKQLGLITALPKNDKELVNLQMKAALEKIAFLPFGRMIDQWRWDVFAGKTKPAGYNDAWWALRLKYQGIAPPVARDPAADFDPGAKYHIPSNTPYMRYFLADILQFQFHRALCKAAGFDGPLHECSIYGNKAAGEKLKALLSLGASKPWPEALFAMTGQKQMDATAVMDYFQPLQTWLTEQNKGQKCGW